MSKALYRKYRSKTLSEIVGQEHITDVLARAIAANNTGHAYLLTGPRGTGKTSTARILAHEINHLPYESEDEYLDIIEIDAASNNGVDDVRDLREKAMIAPVSAKKKVYIIDEVHMLSKQAFNALLKTLEEPPEHAVFILATTDVDKVPATIMSRTQRFHFHLISSEKIAKHLAFIAKKEKILIDDAALLLIAERGGGSLRDSISLLDQLQHLSNDTITKALVERTLGLASHDEIEEILSGMVAEDASAIVSALQKTEAKGVSAPTLASQLQVEVRQRIAENPRFVHYLEGLTQVAKSAHPDVTLLVTLLKYVVTSTPVTRATAVQQSSAAKQTQKPKTTIAPTASSPKREAAPPEPEETKQPKQEENSTKPSSNKSEKPTISINEFDWDAVLTHIASNKDKSIGVYSLLTKCGHEFDGTTLTLYAGNKFSKAKLDSAKNQAALAKVIRELYGSDIDIITHPTSAPLKDEQAAKIAAMMGGGEEVNVETT